MELNKDDIIDWAVNWASYKELEEVSKALYSLYVQRRKADKPETHKRIRLGKKRPQEVYPGMNGPVIIRRTSSK
jgi:hypothetical protein